MKSEELKHALRLLTKMLAEPSLRPDHADQLRFAKRELEAVARSGKLDRPRVFRTVETIAKVLIDSLSGGTR